MPMRRCEVSGSPAAKPSLSPFDPVISVFNVCAEILGLLASISPSSVVSIPICSEPREGSWE